MAEELDPMLDATLERRLRDALRSDVDSVPFTLRADTLRRVRDERRRARRARWTSMLAAAAVVVVAVAGVWGLVALQGQSRVALTPSPTASAETGLDAGGLATYAVLRDALVARGITQPQLDLEHPVAESGTIERLWSAGSVVPSENVLVALSCSGGPMALEVVANGRPMRAQTDSCDGSEPYTVLVLDGTLVGPGGPGTVEIHGAPSVRWRLVMGVRGAAPSDSPSPSLSPSSTPAPLTNAELLVAAGQGAVQLQSLAGDAATQDQVVRFDAFPYRGALALVVACAGGDSVGVAFSSDPLPSSDPGGSDSPFSDRIACDGSAQVAPIDGWNAAFLNSGYKVGLSVPAGITYRAVLVDTSAVAAIGEDTPWADGLPTFAHLSAVHWDDAPGIVIATQERLTAASGTGAPVQAADIRAANTAFVLVTCLGGTAEVTVGGGTASVSLGKPTCDGTVQRLEWGRSDGPPDAASVLVTAAPDTSWRVVVRGIGSSHPKPAVPCGSEAGLKSAPGATLYQDGKAIGSASTYWVSNWLGMYDDGVPVVPTTALDVRAGAPLQLRVVRDVCATGWTALYGTPGAGGMGIDPVGALAFDGGYVTTETDHQNRLDLASLPAGDWVLEITLAFDVRGSGTMLLRVNAR